MMLSILNVLSRAFAQSEETIEFCH